MVFPPAPETLPCTVGAFSHDAKAMEMAVKKYMAYFMIPIVFE
jgi:hypothetical protein